MKTCTKCGKSFPATPKYFYRQKSSKDGLRSQCKKCRSKYYKRYLQSEKGKAICNRAIKKHQQTEKYRQTQLRLKYGITLEQYDQLFEIQNGVCAICGGINDNGCRLCVDHNHKTGKIRGLLCRRCNLKIGQYETIKQSAINYLKIHNHA